MEQVAHLLFLCAVFNSHCLSTVEGKVVKDEIHSLPGWSGPLPTKQYSGYLSPISSTTKRFHYWFVESANDPSKDPVVLWLNGGPGCSSLDGYFNENGPLHFKATSGAANQEIPSLVENPYAWNKIANVIFLESPAGVGFSYSTNPEVDYTTDDIQTAVDNYGVLISFFQAYPEYGKHEFYVTGESYAGVYIPTLVDTIMQMNKNISRTSKNFINLKGFMVGNGCIGNSVGACGHPTGLKIHMDFYNAHGLISQKLYKQLVLECKDYTNNMSQTCSDLISQAAKGIGNVNIYDIYKPCNKLLDAELSIPRRRNFLKEHHLFHKSDPYFGPDECIDDRVQRKYLNNPEVRKAIHMEPISVTGKWKVCGNKLNYIESISSLLGLYPTLIKNYRVLVFNGDVDGCVPYTGNEMWTSGLNLPVKKGWRAWSLDNQVAGYITEYVDDFKFVTVKGSGHMVPQFKPKQTYAMFEKFLKNLTF